MMASLTATAARSEFKLLIFNVHPIGSFKVKNGTNTTILQELLPVNWNLTNSYSLTQSLSNQIENNYTDFNVIYHSCTHNDEPFKDVIMSGGLVDGTPNFKEYDINPKDKPALCAKFLDRTDGYFDNFSRDEDALSQEGFDVTLYAVVLLRNDEYYGHIYTWLSPINPKICFAMGIRNRVDSLFLTNHVSVTGLLLEGVRRFALLHHCDDIFVPFPLRVMRSILSGYGFELVPIKEELLGTSINYQFHGFQGYVVDSFGIFNIKQPFTDIPYQIKIYN